MSAAQNLEGLRDESYQAFCKTVLYGVPLDLSGDQLRIFNSLDSGDFEVVSEIEDDLVDTIAPAILHTASNKVLLSDSMRDLVIDKAVARYLNSANCENNVIPYLYDNYYNLPIMHKLRAIVTKVTKAQRGNKKSVGSPLKGPAKNLVWASGPSGQANQSFTSPQADFCAPLPTLTTPTSSRSSTSGPPILSPNKRSPRVKIGQPPKELAAIFHQHSVNTLRAKKDKDGQVQPSTSSHLQPTATASPFQFKEVKLEIEKKRNRFENDDIPLRRIRKSDNLFVANAKKTVRNDLQLSCPIDDFYYEVLVAVLTGNQEVGEVDALIRDKVAAVKESGLFTSTFIVNPRDFLPTGWRLIKQDLETGTSKYLVRASEVGEIWREAHAALSSTMPPPQMLEYIDQRFIGISTRQNLRDIGLYDLIPRQRVVFGSKIVCLGQHPMQHIQIDIISMAPTRFKESTYDFALMVTDCFSGFVFGRALPNDTFNADTVVRHLMEILGSYGPPEAYRVNTNCGTLIEDAMKSIEAVFTINIRYAGIGPDLTRDVVAAIYRRAEKQDMGSKEHWVVSLPFAIIDYNQTPLRRFDYLLSPFEIMFKRRPWTTPLPPWIDHGELEVRITTAMQDKTRDRTQHNTIYKRMMKIKEEIKQQGITDVTAEEVLEQAGKQTRIRRPAKTEEEKMLDRQWYEATYDRNRPLHELLREYTSPKFTPEYAADGSLFSAGTTHLYKVGDHIFVRNPLYFRKNRVDTRYYRGVIVELDTSHIEMLYKVRYWEDDQEQVDGLPATVWPAADDGFDSCEAWFAAWDVAATTLYMHKIRAVEISRAALPNAPCRCGCGSPSEDGCRMASRCCVVNRTRCDVHLKLRKEFEAQGGSSERNANHPRNVAAFDAAMSVFRGSAPAKFIKTRRRHRTVGRGDVSKSEAYDDDDDDDDNDDDGNNVSGGNDNDDDDAYQEYDGVFNRVMKDLIPNIKVPFKRLYQRAIADTTSDDVDPPRKKPLLTLNLPKLQAPKFDDDVSNDEYCGEEPNENESDYAPSAAATTTSKSAYKSIQLRLRDSSKRDRFKRRRPASVSPLKLYRVGVNNVAPPTATRKLTTTTTTSMKMTTPSAPLKLRLATSKKKDRLPREPADEPYKRQYFSYRNRDRSARGTDAIPMIDDSKTDGRRRSSRRRAEDSAADDVLNIDLGGDADHTNVKEEPQPSPADNIDIPPTA